MWPWDETNGQQIAGDQHSTRPAEKLAKFAMASVPGLWPPIAASPQCADMIDYLGLEDDRLPHGFCYDDTPFGAAPPEAFVQDTQRLRTNLSIFLDPGASEANRLSAAKSALPQDFAQSESLVRVLTEENTSPAVKAEALTLLVRREPAEGLKQAVEAAKGPDATFAAAAARELVRMHNFGQMSDGTRADVYQALVELAESVSAPNPGSPQMQAIVLEFLASHRDERVSPLLKELIENHLNSPLPLRKLVALTRHYPEHLPLLRHLLGSKQQELAVAALWALEEDKETLDKRLEMVTEKNVDPTVRRSAMRSVMAVTPNALSALLQVATDSSESLDVRAEAVAGVRITIAGHRRALGDRVAEAAAALEALQLPPESELSKTVELTLESLAEAKK
jgi:hypothetical protein